MRSKLCLILIRFISINHLFFFNIRCPCGSLKWRCVCLFPFLFSSCICVSSLFSWEWAIAERNMGCTYLILKYEQTFLFIVFFLSVVLNSLLLAWSRLSLIMFRVSLRLFPSNSLAFSTINNVTSYDKFWPQENKMRRFIKLLRNKHDREVGLDYLPHHDIRDAAEDNTGLKTIYEGRECRVEYAEGLPPF